MSEASNPVADASWQPTAEERPLGQSLWRGFKCR